MKRTTLLLIILGLILIGGISLFKGPSSDNPPTTPTGDAQKVVLSMKNYNYYPNTVTVQVNKPVQITLDNSVAGCLRAFTIPELKLAKVLRTPSDTLEFTPTKKGTYRFQCSMNMGYGTLIVE
jgi:plastocyanin domain-containing protein